MKRFLLLFLFNFSFVYSQYTFVPDEYFEQELINQGIDSDNTINGVVLTSDISTITTLIIPGGFFNNLTGIEDFVSLERFEIYLASNLTSLDLSNCPNLRFVICLQTAIYDINVSNCLLLEELYVVQNNLTSLNISNNNLLKILGCSGNYLTSLNVANNSNLIRLVCYTNLLTSLNISNNSELKVLAAGNNDLSSIDVSNNLELEILEVYSNELETIDISNNLQLKELNITNNFISQINLSENINLEILNCGNNLFENLDLSNNALINQFNCSNNPNLHSINLQNGSNQLLNGTYPDYGHLPPTYYNRFRANNNPNLTCIYVDDVANCNENWLGIDSNSHYVSLETECNMLQINNFEKSQISISPNPTNDFLNISNYKQIKELVLIDMLGKVILKKKTNFDRIEMSNLDNGIYFLKIITSDNSENVIKIIKH